MFFLAVKDFEFDFLGFVVGAHPATRAASADPGGTTIGPARAEEGHSARTHLAQGWSPVEPVRRMPRPKPKRSLDVLS